MEKEKPALATPSRSVVLQEPVARLNGYAVLHFRSGRSGAPAP